ncbi:BMP family ABC transporter substrate-binding protein [Metabacillus sediminilitoris]|uniref:BMP family ABC transporter substrate-binding protein n=1 Tax=Metabacillus sediminilitoris TaxID=2567941 RepID=A0A4S4BV34_9BACI|nr:BMP family ABC transporter substrate-binding protein [Metabacillus sediminilitoris]QGQ44652.1 BMP family ABC transporter substrate-binding protein [Metabacillus sediminilitoris]THF78998.1 BMP family ABC transporter substrate-binding protein [Metabacillus sediminilitoris]
MYKKLGLILILLFSLYGCGQPTTTGNLQKVGLLVQETIDEKVWGMKGYEGLLKIQSDLGVDVFYKEGMNEDIKIRHAIEEFQQNDVNLIFGHGSEFAGSFQAISKDYPDIHFVLFNSDVSGRNITSLNFESHAMGFFGGMVAGEMTNTKKIGVLAAFEWQPEIDGFFEGAYFQNENVHVNIKYVQDWNNTADALPLLEEMIDDNVDIVYVAGDGYNIPVIERLKEEGLYAIGYVNDQADLGNRTVLTSTVQHIDELYVNVAKSFNKGELENGEVYFDFKDGVISMGEFSPLVDQEFQSNLNEHIEEYKKSGLLPNQL